MKNLAFRKESPSWGSHGPHSRPGRLTGLENVGQACWTPGAVQGLHAAWPRGHCLGCRAMLWSLYSEHRSDCGSTWLQFADLALSSQGLPTR